MIITQLRLKNWRNFRHVDIPLSERLFVVGPNASGKSNLLDVFRFLRDIAKQEGGGLQKAMSDRGGMSKLRCLTARKDPAIVIDVELGSGAEEAPSWRYELGIAQEQRGHRQVFVAFENVWKDGNQILARPDAQDKIDHERLKQTYLEQVNANKDFREIARNLATITYLHIVPQLLRYPEIFQASVVEHDPFGQGLLERVAKMPDKTRAARLSTIEKALRMAVPQLKELGFERDTSSGRPHLKALYSHWRPNAGWQREDQFSDGTLRLVGLLWSLLEGDSLLLLEEPELSLNDGITRHLSGLIHRMQRRRRRQVFVTTHSETLLNDPGIDGSEVLLLHPDAEGTIAQIASDLKDVRDLLQAGVPAGEVVLARTRSKDASQLELFDD